MKTMFRHKKPKIEALEEGKLYACRFEEVGFLIYSKKEWQDLYADAFDDLEDGERVKGYDYFAEVKEIDSSNFYSLISADMFIIDGPTQKIFEMV